MKVCPKKIPSFPLTLSPNFTCEPTVKLYCVYTMCVYIYIYITLILIGCWGLSKLAQ